ncbi:MAG: hypothetical protein FWD18_11415 [Micrococcales bacterium]|nr:hypothetical protein [Micrococcales bacterium]
MVAITIRDVPEQTRRTLAARAASQGQSMQEYLRTLLDRTVASPTQDEILEQIRQRARTMPPLDLDRTLDEARQDRR